MLTILSEEFPLVATWLNELRDNKIQKDRIKFRRNIERIGEAAALEISKHLPTVPIKIETPLASCDSFQLQTQPVLTTILRAGVPLFQGVLNYFDQADCGFVAAYRKHNGEYSFKIKQDYVTSPDINGRPLIIADPMLATGASLLEAIGALLAIGEPSQLHIVAVIASKFGVDKLRTAYPDAALWVGGLDPDLTKHGYISPGLGDAGDLCFGPKLQQ